MPSLFLYLLKLSISLSIVWLFYQVFLRRLTFYKLNRWYLLGYSMLSFLIPLINIGPMFGDDPAGEPLVIQYIPAIGNVEARALLPTVKHSSINEWNALVGIIVLGAMLLLIRSAARWFSLRRLRKQARLIISEGLKIYQVEERIIPFSFGGAIYINQHLHSEKEWSDIILHEYVHIRQKHTIDILLAELMCMFNWYNPFCWLVRHSIRQNLEFIADSQVLDSGVDKKGYQYHLLQVIGEPRYRLATNFNFSSLKKRIVMMNKIRSARLHLLKLLFLLPLVAVLLVAFRDQYTGIWKRSSGEVYVNTAGIVIDIVSKTPLAGVNVHEKSSGLQTVTDYRGFYKLAIPVTSDSIRIRLDYTKTGYDSTFSVTFFPSVKATRGLLSISAMVNPSQPLTGAYISVPYSLKPPADPGYADAMVALQVQLKLNADLDKYQSMQKAHPEVSMFYTTEDKQKQIVIHTDGSLEKYGYAGGPSVTDMEKKYGQLPGFLTGDAHPVNAGYLSRWEKISAEAEKAFHATNPDALVILFPGDSRVIVVPVSGKPRFYDMDNGDPKERPAFESQYGKLPDCVPAPGFDTGNLPGVGKPARPAVKEIGHYDTVPKIPPHVLYVIDGQEMSKDSMPMKDQIYSIDVLKDEKALKYFGEKAANGVVVITTKAFYELHKHVMQPAQKDSIHEFGKNGPPLYIVDDKEISADSAKTINSTLNPDDIESITILKSKDAIAKYGEKAKNGVVIIMLKRKSSLALPAHSKVLMTMNSKEGPMSLIADTLIMSRMTTTKTGN